MNFTKLLPVFLFCCLLSLTASAQWKDTTYSLQGGWNAIYLHGDATHATPDLLFATGDGLQIEEIWRWNPNPSQVQFTSDPFVPSPGTPEWSTWYRTPPGGQQGTLSALTGQSAYLVKCSGTAASNYSVTLSQKILPPRAAWVRNGANLLGFPAAPSSPPSIANYFATFPAAIAANTKIFKYTGGDLGPTNPLQVFSPNFESLDRNKAYWFEAEVSGSFFAPLEITTNSADGIDFGRTGSVVTLRLRNRSAATVTVTMTPAASDAPPSGSVSPVPLTLRTFNNGTGLYDETPISGSINQAIGPQASVEISLGIDRAAMTNPGELYASFLTLTDSANLMEVDMPVSAELASLAGLWFGAVEVDQVQATAISIGAAAEIDYGAVTAVKLLSSGGSGYLTAPAVTIEAPLSGTPATAIATVEDGTVTGFIVTDGGSGYQSLPDVSVASPPLTGTSVSRPFPLRYLLHIDDAGVGRLLSQAFVGTLVSTDELGIATTEAGLRSDAKGSASRLVSAHLPLDQVLSTGTGSVALGGSLERSVVLNFDSSTNPFVHQFHPDHNNKSPRGDALSAGEESHTVTRSFTFDFALNPPPGMASTGWGASVLAGDYTEEVAGIYKGDQTLTTAGTFIFRRINDIGTLTTP